MIKIKESPQRADMKISYAISNDILTITLDGVSEVFDFTGMPEGKLDSVEVESLKLNPIISAEKIGEEITVEVLRFYGVDEKHIYEL